MTTFVGHLVHNLIPVGILEGPTELQTDRLSVIIVNEWGTISETVDLLIIDKVTIDRMGLGPTTRGKTIPAFRILNITPGLVLFVPLDVLSNVIIVSQTKGGLTTPGICWDPYQFDK